MDFSKLEQLNAPARNSLKTGGVELAKTAEVLDLAVAPEVAEYDIAEARRRMELEARNSPEVQALVNSIDPTNATSIAMFGHDAVEPISKVADTILASTDIEKLTTGSALIKQLDRIMDIFEPTDLRTEEGWFSRTFGNAKKKLQKILDKYNTMGAQIEKIYLELYKYQEEIMESDRQLQALFFATVESYEQLCKTIIAADMGVEEMDEYLEGQRRRFAETGDQQIQMRIQAIQQNRELLAQRALDLRKSETIAMQSVPMMQRQQFDYANLLRRINSGFIVTLPAFKRAVVDAVTAKQRRLYDESLSELDRRTNELMVKGAQEAVQQSLDSARKVTEGSVTVDTLEQTWKIIKDGSAELLKIQAANAEKVKADSEKLKALKEDFIRNSTGISGGYVLPEAQ